MTDNEPTERYWRDERGQLFHVITRTGHVLAERDESWSEVVVMTPAELAEHTKAARADAWDEGHISGRVDAYHDAYPGKPNPYRSTESED